MSKQSDTGATTTPADGSSRIWNGQAFEADAWHTLGDDQKLAEEDFVLMSLSRWRAEKSKLPRTGSTHVAMKLAPGDEINHHSDEINRLALIVLPFPKFTDGRSYSTARQLREQWGYTNELRATGDVLFDQIPLMARCGFTSFEITDAATIRALERSDTTRTNTTRPNATRMCRMYQSPAPHGDLKRRAPLPRELIAAE